MPTKKTHRTIITPEPKGFSIGNIVNSAIGGLVILLVTWALNKSSNNSDKLNHLTEQVPMIVEKVGDVKTEVKDVKSELKVTQGNMVTRTELQNKNDRLTDSI